VDFIVGLLDVFLLDLDLIQHIVDANSTLLPEFLSEELVGVRQLARLPGLAQSYQGFHWHLVSRGGLHQVSVVGPSRSIDAARSLVHHGGCRLSSFCEGLLGDRRLASASFEVPWEILKHGGNSIVGEAGVVNDRTRVSFVEVALAVSVAGLV